MRDMAVFLGEALRNPAEVVALAPSSAATARRMTAGLERVAGTVIEIGPGTGVFTRAILARGVAPERLVLLETNARFCAELARAFPGVHVINRPAQAMHALGLAQVGAVISGVPVLARPTIQRDILGQAFRLLAPEGFLTQITYSPLPPVGRAVRAELGLAVEHLGTVWGNLPPAQVFRFTRAARALATAAE
ncbi:MAG: methyltransferase type 12 [Rhodobacteraceae bacterium]|nr:methyltransferase type 12 [Paracoccaceae bacterium]